MKRVANVEIAIIGAGVIGIATAYYLSKKYQCKSVLLIDCREPMSYTSAQSGDNYRNWWPSEVMTQFADHSISLMHDIARQSSNILQIKQRGYALATRRNDIDDLLETLDANYSKADGLVRVHTQASASTYQGRHNENWDTPVDGVDVISNKALIKQTFPEFSHDIENVLHIRRAGDFSSQQMAEFMLQQIKPLGCTRLRGEVKSVVKDQRYQFEIATAEGLVSLNADVIVDAAGPYVAEIAGMLGVDLPVENIFQQKLAFQDHLSAIPRNQPFSIDIDETRLSWSLEEQAGLADDVNLSWLTKPIDGGIHCRPEGSGDWVKLGWAYNRQVSTPDNTKQLNEDPQYDPYFPEVVIRGAAKLNPNLTPYIDKLPTARMHYGGYYTMTKENWPIVGPLDQSAAFVAGALSGFGSMGACAAGSLCADWIGGGQLPHYAQALSLSRYDDPECVRQVSNADIGLL